MSENQSKLRIAHVCCEGGFDGWWREPTHGWIEQLQVHQICNRKRSSKASYSTGEAALRALGIMEHVRSKNWENSDIWGGGGEWLETQFLFAYLKAFRMTSFVYRIVELKYSVRHCRSSHSPYHSFHLAFKPWLIQNCCRISKKKTVDWDRRHCSYSVINAMRWTHGVFPMNMYAFSLIQWHIEIESW